MIILSHTDDKMALSLKKRKSIANDAKQRIKLRYLPEEI
jgi:hypothetical protein